MFKHASTRAVGVNHSLIQDTLDKFSLVTHGLVATMNDSITCLSWMTLIIFYIEVETLPTDPVEANIIKRITCSYLII